MKLLSNVFVSEVDGEYVAVATGKAGKNFSGMVQMNATSAFIVNALRKKTNEKKLAASLMEEYDVTEEEATKNIEKVLGQLRKAGWLDE